MEKLSTVLKMFVIYIPGIFLLSFGNPCRAAGNEEAKIKDATSVLQDVMEMSEKGIPRSLLEETEGVMVIPDVIKVGYIIGGRHGKGILVVKQKDGSWSNPVFVELRAGSVGWQIGVQATDLVLLFQNKKSINAILEGEFTLGADASVSAGPQGRGIGAGTNVEFEAEIYSYSKSRGLFAGVALEGASLQIDHSATETYYGKQELKVEQVLWEKVPAPPGSAVNFRKTFEKYVKSKQVAPGKD